MVTTLQITRNNGGSDAYVDLINMPCAVVRVGRFGVNASVLIIYSTFYEPISVIAY